jgi:multicomponent K+:H+ antiporter subunit E
MMKPPAFVAHPALTVVLAASWLLLQQSLAPAHLLSAAVLGVVLPRLLGRFLPATVRVRWWPAVRLLQRVLWDIVMSNITVARQVLGPLAALQPAWVVVPLVLTHPTGMALLAAIITTTPGTVSCHIDEERREILVHALHCTDPAQLAQDIQARYETLLLAIFESAPSPEPDEQATNKAAHP